MVQDEPVPSQQDIVDKNRDIPLCEDVPQSDFDSPNAPQTLTLYFSHVSFLERTN